MSTTDKKIRETRAFSKGIIDICSFLFVSNNTTTKNSSARETRAFPKGIIDICTFLFQQHTKKITSARLRNAGMKAGVYYFVSYMIEGCNDCILDYMELEYTGAGAHKLHAAGFL